MRTPKVPPPVIWPAEIYRWLPSDVREDLETRLPELTLEEFYEIMEPICTPWWMRRGFATGRPQPYLTRTKLRMGRDEDY